MTLNELLETDLNNEFEFPSYSHEVECEKQSLDLLKRIQDFDVNEFADYINNSKDTNFSYLKELTKKAYDADDILSIYSSLSQSGWWIKSDADIKVKNLELAICSLRNQCYDSIKKSYKKFEENKNVETAENFLEYCKIGDIFEIKLFWRHEAKRENVENYVLHQNNLSIKREKNQRDYENNLIESLQILIDSEDVEELKKYKREDLEFQKKKYNLLYSKAQKIIRESRDLEYESELNNMQKYLDYLESQKKILEDQEKQKSELYEKKIIGLQQEIKLCRTKKSPLNSKQKKQVDLISYLQTIDTPVNPVSRNLRNVSLNCYTQEGINRVSSFFDKLDSSDRTLTQEDFQYFEKVYCGMQDSVNLRKIDSSKAIEKFFNYLEKTRLQYSIAV